MVKPPVLTTKNIQRAHRKHPFSSQCLYLLLSFLEDKVVDRRLCSQLSKQGGTFFRSSSVPRGMEDDRYFFVWRY